MKSVIHEASSIIKAIDQAWEKAGKPTDFSVKILEEAQKNFFGFTVRSAKVALFFDREDKQPKGLHIKQAGKMTTRMHKGTEPRRVAPARPQPEARIREAQKAPHPTPEQHAPAVAPAKPIKKPAVESPKPAKQFNPLWNDEMISYVNEWMAQTLGDMNMSQVRFAVEPSRFHLHITFSQPILPDKMQERKLFASFALLILESLKHRFKLGLHGHKIVLAHAASQQSTDSGQQ